MKLILNTAVVFVVSLFSIRLLGNFSIINIDVFETEQIIALTLFLSLLAGLVKTYLCDPY